VSASISEMADKGKLTAPMSVSTYISSNNTTDTQKCFKQTHSFRKSIGNINVIFTDQSLTLQFIKEEFTMQE